MTECIEKARTAIVRGRKPKEDQNGKIKRGIGLACMNHTSGNRTGNNFDGSSSMVRFQEDGKLVLYHGESDMGQGARTVLAQIAAETLGIRPEDVQIRQDGDLTGEVALVEPLGVETIVHIRSGTQALLSVVPGMTDLHFGDEVRFSVVSERLHFFGLDGARILR